MRVQHIATFKLCVLVDAKENLCKMQTKIKGHAFKLY